MWRKVSVVKWALNIYRLLFYESLRYEDQLDQSIAAFVTDVSPDLIIIAHLLSIASVQGIIVCLSYF